jgi:hypothetical protein
MVEPTQLRAPLSPKRIRLRDPKLLQPLERLLLIINDPDHHQLMQMDAIREALPYTAETIEQRNERLRLEAERELAANTAALKFDFGSLNSARAIHRAQMKVMKAVGTGALMLEAGHRLIAMLDAMRKAAADVITEEKLLDYEASRNDPVEVNQ